jgi:hypothetical protein
VEVSLDGLRSELEVLLEQLDELLAEGAVDPEDALEIAVVAGLAERLGATPEAVAEARAWRDGPGRDLLAEVWGQIDEDALLEAVEACAVGEVEEEDLEEAIYDVDEVVVAAIWAGNRAAVRNLSRQASRIVRTVPERFAPLADVGATFAKLPTVAFDLDLYDYWFALADAAQWAEPVARA